VITEKIIAVSHISGNIRRCRYFENAPGRNENYYYFDANMEAMNRLIQMIEYARSIMK